jgi:mono/diheme cytochrome c family protein
MLGSLPSPKKNLGAPLQSRKAMLETLFRHLDMVRLSAGAILMVALVSCTGLIDGGSDGLTPQQRDAATKWKSKALPVLRDQCVGCHNGSRPNIDFLSGDKDADIRTRVMTYTPAVVNLDAPGSSRLLSKGLHEGPEFNSEDLSSVLQWIQAEKGAQDSDPATAPPLLATAPLMLTLCPSGTAANQCPLNHASLEMLPDIGPMLPGAEISFSAFALDTAIYVTNLKLNGGTAGVNIEHPLFVSVPATGDAIPDKIDRYFDVKMNEKAGGADPISGGAASFEGFLKDNMVEIHFKIVQAFKPDTTAPPSNMCKALPLFKSNVAGLLNTNCASCHTGGGNGKGALDMTGVNATDDATLLIACNQVRTTVDLVTPTNSALFKAPDPGSATNHPFKFPAATFTSYQTSVNAWIQAEKTAP